MGRLVIQLIALLCLAERLLAAPSCAGVDRKDFDVCNSLSRRWYQLQDEIYLKTCPTLQPGAVGFDSCMQTVNRSATEQLTSEVETEDNGNLTNRIALGASAVRTALGTLIELNFKRKKFWWWFW